MVRNKKVLAIILVAFIAILVVLLGLKIAEKKEIQSRSERNTHTLEQLAEVISLDLEDSMKPTVLIYMNSECEHCQRQLNEMVKIEEDLEDTQIILISFESIESLNLYLKRVPFKERGSIILHHILPEKVDHAFASSGVPQIYVYDKNQLVRSFKGETRAQLISEALKN